MISFRTVLLVLLVSGLAGSLAACEKKVPGGQVVATVDNEEVTRRELASEPDAARLSGGDDPASLAAILSGVIDRKLAAAEAKRLKLDRTPEYVAQSSRLTEVVLSRTLFDNWAANLPRPGDREVANYIARNPQRFDGHKFFLVDRIEAAPYDGQAKDLEPLQTNDAVAAYLEAHSKAYRRAQTVLDSANVPLPLYRQLLISPPGYPLALMQNGRLVVLALLQTRDAPIPREEHANAAAKALMQEAVQKKLAGLRRTATIAYQAGYRPIAPPVAKQSSEPVAMP